MINFQATERRTKKRNRVSNNAAGSANPKKIQCQGLKGVNDESEADLDGALKSLRMKKEVGLMIQVAQVKAIMRIKAAKKPSKSKNSLSQTACHVL